VTPLDVGCLTNFAPVVSRCKVQTGRQNTFTGYNEDMSTFEMTKQSGNKTNSIV